MKRIIIFLSIFLYANNELLPIFLKYDISSNIYLHYHYNTLQNSHLIGASLRVRIKKIENALNKIIPKKIAQSKNYSFTIKTYIKSKHKKPTIEIMPYFSYKKNRFTFNEYISYFTFLNEYSETTEIFYNLTKKIFFKASKNFNSKSINYNFEIYKYNQSKKLSKTIGLSLSGENKLSPFIYSYNLFYAFKYKLNKHLFFTITPGILYSKSFYYTPKAYINTEIEAKF